MRHTINRLQTHDLPWEESGPGVYSKMLNLNPDTGERTVLVKFVPAEGMKAPSQCHYHSYYEELLCVDGRLTFDSKNWLTRFSYCFHPAGVVHGFKSDVPISTVLLARSPQELDFNLLDVAMKNTPYSIDGTEPTRPWCYKTDVMRETWEPVLDDRGNQIGEHLVLGTDSVTGEQSAYIRYEAGAHVPGGEVSGAFEEVFILDGSLTREGEEVLDAGGYWHLPDGTARAAMTAPGGALVFRVTQPRSDNSDN